MMRWVVLAGCLVWLGTVFAQPLEILTLKYRGAEQLVPQLQPLLEPGGVLTGTGNKLFLRTSPRNLDDIRHVVAEIDREPRRLVIYVRQGAAREDEAHGVVVSGNVELGREARASVLRAEAGETRTSGRDDIVQQVQTIEGGRAWIEVGSAQPLPTRQVTATPHGMVVTDTVAYRDVGTGFYAAPRLAGDRVTLEISPGRDTVGPSGSVNIQHLTTTVAGRLGEWIELGGSEQRAADERRSLLGTAARDRRDERRVWLEVEELR